MEVKVNNKVYIFGTEIGLWKRPLNVKKGGNKVFFHSVVKRVSVWTGQDKLTLEAFKNKSNKEIKWNTIHTGICTSYIYMCAFTYNQTNKNFKNIYILAFCSQCLVCPFRVTVETQVQHFVFSVDYKLYKCLLYIRWKHTSEYYIQFLK